MKNKTQKQINNMKNKTQKQIVIENCLFSDLSNMISELKHGGLNEELILQYFSDFLKDAKVESEIIVNLLEYFGDLGKGKARNIKVEEGW